MICYLNDHTGLSGTIPWSFVVAKTAQMFSSLLMFVFSMTLFYILHFMKHSGRHMTKFLTGGRKDSKLSTEVLMCFTEM